MNLFNKQSEQLINNICNEFRSHPVYLGYDIDTYIYDINTGSVMLDVGKNGVVKHKYLLSIKNSGICFGLPVVDVSIDNEGMSRFIDVYIGDYSHLV